MNTRADLMALLDSLGVETVTHDHPAVFRVGRVTSARLLTAGVVRPDGFDLAAFWERWSAEFVTSRSQVEVRVRATATALGIFPYVFGDAGTRAQQRPLPPRARRAR